MQQTALFRADASPTIGAGHMTRCLALAEALAEAGWQIAFAVGHGTAGMASAITGARFALHELDAAPRDEAAALRAACPDGVDLLAVDHYQRDVRFETACRGWANRILAFDDGTGRDHDCDFLLDAAAADRSVYDGRVPAAARLLLGPSYALVRRCFLACRPAALARRDGRAVAVILVSFGATDPNNVTATALDALADIADEYSIIVALSSRAPHLDEVHRKLRGRMRLILDADMAGLITEADLAIGAAGASAFERAALGLPSIVVTLADNQRSISQTLFQSGAGVDAGRFDDGFALRLRGHLDKLVADKNERRQVSQAAHSLVDGEGARRVVAALIRGYHAQRMRPLLAGSSE